MERASGGHFYRDWTCAKLKLETFYITTPIYYSSGRPHVGTAYCSIASDVMARYKKARGFEVKFLTGNDEFGQKNEEAAKERGVSTMQHLDDMAVLFQDMAKAVDVDYDIFWRTTDERHQRAVQTIFRTLHDKGDIYKGHYEGLYCTPCETFYTDGQVNDGNCPDCGRAVHKMQEEAYFFRMSKYQDALLAHIEENPDFIMPVSRKNEMINNFLKPGLDDLCVSRTSFKWGIPVDFDPDHVVYVWVDALSNYANALGFLSKNDEEYRKFWPADIHMVGKEIVRFHTLIWPAILMALGEPLPKQVFGHGWLTSEGRKVSKSFGNAIDPHMLVDRYGSDALRYFLMREFTFGNDGDFRNEALLTRINADLANDLGNLLSRTVGMIEKYFGGELVVKDVPDTEFETALKELVSAMPGKIEPLMDRMNFSETLNEIWAVIRRANKYTDETQPWVLCKDAEKSDYLALVLYNLAEVLRIISVVIAPFMPKTPAEIRKQLNIEKYDWESTKIFGLTPREIKVQKGAALFPRLDIQKELAELTAIQQSKIEQAEAAVPQKPEITIDEFSKMDLKVGEIVACEAMKKTKLLKSQVRIGTEVRQIVSGISAFYTPEQMLGKKVIVVTNLKPIKLRGEISQGMILAAADGTTLNLLTVDGEIESGATVS
ncbi:MAG: methionine--tRNA ligase [Turicibacter sp.]|nr:methionine--tRNA ligase [Turicibacter sp.]